MELSLEQRIVVDDLSGNFLLLAPAGTGKTNTLSARIAAILERKMAKASEILCLTFTNKACREMRERIEKVAGDISGDATIRTIHGFGYHLLLEYGGMDGEKASGTGICDEEDSLGLFEQIIRSHTAFAEQGCDAAATVKMISAFAQLVKHQMYRERTTDIMSAASSLIKNEENIIRSSLCVNKYREPDRARYDFLNTNGAVIIQKYQKLMSDMRLYDFHDLVLQAGMLLENEVISGQLRERYKYVHIDEVQDISDVEYDIITRMFPGAIFLLSGDINQTIYEWRGSLPREILPRFTREFSARTVYLDKNYRSSPGLVNIGRRFACMALEKKEPPPERYVHAEVVKAGFRDEEEQALGIFKAVQNLKLNGDYSRVAVLFRSNEQCKRLSELLADLQKSSGDYNMRFMVAEEFKLLRAVEIKDILAGVRFTINDNDEVSLARILKGYFDGVGERTIKEIQALGETLGVRLSDYISDAVWEHGDYFLPLEKALDNGNVVVFDVESTGVDIYSERIIQAAAVRIGKGGVVLEKFMEFIIPSKPVGSSEKVHHFSDDFLKQNGKPPGEVLARLSAFLNGKIIVGHNVGYDTGILGEELRRCGLPPLAPAGVYDTLDIARRYIPNAANHKLETLSELMGTMHKPSHDAMDDILATAGLLDALIERYIEPDNEARARAYAKYASKFKEVREALAILRGAAPNLSTARFCGLAVDTLGVRKKYSSEDARLKNIESFLSFLEDPIFNLGGYRQNLFTAVEYSSLSSSELDRLSRQAGKMPIITVHQAKGCEFDYVFVPSLMENIFPNYISVKNGDVSEESRLFYVAITRAKKRLYLSWYNTDTKTGNIKQPSRFWGMI